MKKNNDTAFYIIPYLIIIIALLIFIRHDLNQLPEATQNVTVSETTETNTSEITEEPTANFSEETTTVFLIILAILIVGEIVLVIIGIIDRYREDRFLDLKSKLLAAKRQADKAHVDPSERQIKKAVKAKEKVFKNLKKRWWLDVDKVYIQSDPNKTLRKIINCFLSHGDYTAEKIVEDLRDGKYERRKE